MLKFDVKAPEQGIEGVEYHSHHPYSPTQLTDEIRIAIQHQDLVTLPCHSFIHMEGRFVKEDGSAKPTSATITNNAFMFLFDEIRYDLCGVEIEKIRNPGITSTMKGLVSFKQSSQHAIENYGWSSDPNKNLISEEGYFAVCIPLNTIFGFCEDYIKAIVNVKQELILTRSRRDENCYLSPLVAAAGSGASDGTREKVKIVLSSLSWRVPYLTLSAQYRLTLSRHLQKSKSIPMNFRCFDLYEYPLLPSSDKQLWNVQTAPQIEKPRFVLLAFQTKRKYSRDKSASEFDHCNLINTKLYLNSKSYPYDDLNVNFDRNQYSLLYQMYMNFQRAYYDTVETSPLLSFSDFKSKGPLVVLDCSRQSEAIKTGPIDVSLEFEASQPFPADTSAYCLIIHQRSCEYNPLTNVVRRMVV